MHADRLAQSIGARPHGSLDFPERAESNVVDRCVVRALVLRVEVDETALVPVEQGAVHRQLVDVVGSGAREVVGREGGTARLDLDRPVGKDVDPTVHPTPTDPYLELPGRCKKHAEPPMDSASAFETCLPFGTGGRGWTGRAPVGGSKGQEVRHADRTRGVGRREARGEPTGQFGVLTYRDARPPLGLRFSFRVRRHRPSGNPAEYRTLGAAAEAAIPRASVRGP